MNANAEKWLAALESGEFRQGVGSLRVLPPDTSPPSRPLNQEATSDEDTFCCLGVACELYRREHPDTCRWETQFDHAGRPDGVTFRDDAYPTVAEHGSLSRSVAEWLGIASQSGAPTDLGPSLVTRNDEFRQTFREIAAEIRSNPARYLKEPA